MSDSPTVQHHPIRYTLTTGDIFTRLAKAQSKFQNLTFNRTARMRQGQKDYAYADLKACLDVVKGPLAEFGIALLQPASQFGGTVTVTTVLASGLERVESDLSAPMIDQNFHGLGTAISYLRRYGACAILSLAAEDDDGHDATEKQKEQSKPPERPSVAAPAPPQQVSPPAVQASPLAAFKGKLVDVRTGKAKTSGRPWCKIRLADDAGEEREFWVVKGSWQEFIARNQDSKELVWEISGGPPKEGVSTASDITYHTPAGATVHPDFGDVPF